MTMNEFVDMCILLGCDFAPKIGGLGPKTAPSLIQSHKNIESVLRNLDRSKFQVPANFPFEEVRKLFNKIEVISAEKVSTILTKPDETGLKRFLLQNAEMKENGAKENVKKIVRLFEVSSSFLTHIFRTKAIWRFNKVTKVREQRTY